jgi:hypothetical protein
MTNPRTFFVTITLFLVLCAGALVGNAQIDPKTQAESNNSITLQVIVGSNDAGKNGGLPQNLGDLTRKLKTNFAFSSYQLAGTFLGRIANNGNLEYKSLSNVLGQESDSELQTFLEWSIGNLRSAPDGYQAQSFRFGARVPVKIAQVSDGKTFPVVNYESIGLNMSRIGVPANVPTLLGSLTLPKTNGTLFLVLTVSSSDR